MGDKMWTEPKRPAQPVQQAQTLIKGGTLNSVAAIMVRDDIKPMIALDFIARLGYILPCHDVVHAVGSDYALCGDGSIGQVKHQKHRQRRCELESTDGISSVVIICRVSSVNV